MRTGRSVWFKWICRLSFTNASLNQLPRRGETIFSFTDLFFFSIWILLTQWDLFCSSCIYGKGADTRGVSKVHYLHGMWLCVCVFDYREQKLNFLALASIKQLTQGKTETLHILPIRHTRTHSHMQVWMPGKCVEALPWLHKRPLLPAL